MEALTECERQVIETMTEPGPPSMIWDGRPIRPIPPTREALQNFSNWFHGRDLYYYRSYSPEEGVEYFCRRCQTIQRQTTSQHVRKLIGCPSCQISPKRKFESQLLSAKRKVCSEKYTWTIFLLRARERFGDQYDYSLNVDLSFDEGKNTWIQIRCQEPDCGIITRTTVHHHLVNGQGCPCSGARSKGRRDLMYFFSRAGIVVQPDTTDPLRISGVEIPSFQVTCRVDGVHLFETTPSVEGRQQAIETTRQILAQQQRVVRIFHLWRRRFNGINLVMKEIMTILKTQPQIRLILSDRAPYPWLVEAVGLPDDQVAYVT